MPSLLPAFIFIPLVERSHLYVGLVLSSIHIRRVNAVCFFPNLL